VGQHRSASASRLLGLEGFEVLAAEVVDDEWQLKVQTMAELVGCPGCGAGLRRSVVMSVSSEADPEAGDSLRTPA
jgi:hypothetical protein